MDNNIQIQIAKPFGPSIAKANIPDEMIKKLNETVFNLSYLPHSEVLS